MKFGEKIRDIMKEKGISVAELSRYTGIDSSMLYKILQGKRKPAGRKQVECIARKLRLPERESRELVQDYYREVLGEEKYYGFRQVMDLFNALRPFEITKGGTFSCDTAVLEKNTISGKDEIYNACLAAVEQAAADGETKVGALLCGQYEDFTNLCLPVLQQYETISLELVTTLNQRERLNENYRLFNLDRIISLTSILMRCTNVKTRAVYAGNNTLESLSGLMTEMVVTSRYVILFSADLTCGLVLQKEDAKTMQGIFEKIRKKAVPFLRVYGNSKTFENLKGKSDDAEEEKLWENLHFHYYFDPGISAVNVLPRCKALAEHAVTGKTAHSWYVGQLNSFADFQLLQFHNKFNMTQITTCQGVEWFTRTGYINESGPRNMTPLSVPERLLVLKIWRELYLEGEFEIADLPDFREDSCAWYVASEELFAFWFPVGEGKFRNEVLSDPGTLKLFQEYFDFIHTENTLKKEEGIAFLDRCIAQLQPI
ncbi:MAG: helix-turn-helix transcriptional regulator [Lachnospiraceae bacterium]|jgi:transcriptional regulator with XRE-family HTH domain